MEKYNKIIMSEFKDIILKLRLEKGFNQEEFAKVLNVSKSTIGMWEIGKRLPGPNKYEEIADYFDINIDFLYGRTNIRKRYHFTDDEHEYYLAEQIMQELLKNDRVLFDVYRSTDKDRLIAYAKKLKALRDMEEGEE